MYFVLFPFNVFYQLWSNVVEYSYFNVQVTQSTAGNYFLSSFCIMFLVSVLLFKIKVKLAFILRYIALCVTDKSRRSA